MGDDDPGPAQRCTDGEGTVGPVPSATDVPTPAECADANDPTGYVVWYRKHLRIEDHTALARAVEQGDAVCPLFVFDPTFYGAEGLACDSRVRFLHEALASLARLYATVPADTAVREGTEPDGHVAGRRVLADGEVPDTLRTPDGAGLTFGYGNPVELLSRFVDRGWAVLTMATPTSRYGRRRDERVKAACGDAVTFVSGDGLVRDRERSRTDWQDRVQEWLTAPQRTPAWDEQDATRLVLRTGVTPVAVEERFDVTPTKTKVPTGTHREATKRLRTFVDRIESYPGTISAPGDARGGTSGLSPYLTFGLLSIRQAHQYVTDNAPSCRGREMFTSRLVWNMHYNQKLADWPGWTDRAVNPVLEGRNEDTHDPALVEAWKRGETGFPMVDASMRCLRETGWLNFRMRAMCASFFTHILQQPWWIGADWYHHHLIDSDVGINYTQWQSQAGLVGKPSQRVYNPRKQVRDQDPEGEWITEWAPELAPLPSQFLDRPERTPLAVQEECGVTIGEDYPRPVVDFEARREAFWSRYEQYQPAAARALGRPTVAKRASLSGGYGAATAIAEEYGGDADEETSAQLSLDDLEAASADGEGSAPQSAGGDGTDHAVPRDIPGGTDDPEALPTGAGERAGEPSPDDRAAVPGQPDGEDCDDDDQDDGQTSIRQFD